MRVICKRILQPLLCFALLCCFAVCPTFSIYGSAADNSFATVISRDDYLYTPDIHAFVLKGTTINDRTFDWMSTTPSNNILVPNNRGASLFIGNTSGYTSSDILYSFKLNNFLPFDTAGSTFSVSGTIDCSEFGSYNRPDKFAVVVSTLTEYNKLFNYLLLEGGANLSDDFTETVKLFYDNPNNSDIKLLGLHVGNGPTFNFNVSVAPSVRDQIVITFISYSGNHNNFMLFPIDVTCTPYGDTLQDLKDNQYHQDVIGSDTPDKESGLKGILAKIKALPGVIADKIKSLFVPTDSDIDTFKQNMSNLLSEHLGGVYQAGSILDSFLQKLKDFSPYQHDNCADYDFRLPPFGFFVNPDDSDSGSIFSDSDNGGSRFDLVPVGSDGYYHVDFSFLDNKPYKQIYTVYKAFVTVVFILLALNFCKRKFDEILGGVVS